MLTNSNCCLHEALQVEPSAYAPEVGFERAKPVERLAATTLEHHWNPPTAGATSQRGDKGRGRGSSNASSSLSLARLAQKEADKLCAAFPAPLVLPPDDLAWDPEYPPQSFQSWFKEGHRNKPTKRRQALYVAAVPEIDPAVGYLKDWLQPSPENLSKKKGNKSNSIEALGGAVDQKEPSLAPPRCSDLVEYLSAFYHGLPVMPLAGSLRFVPWEDEKRKKPAKSSASSRKRDDGDQTQVQYVGLVTPDGNCTRIRARMPSPDGAFRGQLNLSDLLDALIMMVPGDAYSIVLMIDHDMYEDEDDDFCCGRAYGGSRVCVVSQARYHPSLDAACNIDYDHMWPSSHCQSYAEKLCTEADVPPRPKKRTKKAASSKAANTKLSPEPLRSAIEAAAKIEKSMAREQLEGLWFSRVARTIAHELGHCLGMDHCVYYACSMQGTAGIEEDVRQPPYLCPVCLAKLSWAVVCDLQAQRDESPGLVGGGGNAKRDEYVKERYRAISRFCEKWSHVGMFSGFGSWAHARLDGMELR